MKCPYCKKELKDGEKKEYETLVDHVFNPNAESYPLRPTWECNCDNSKGLFWDKYGEVYVDLNANPDYVFGTAKNAIS